MAYILFPIISNNCQSGCGNRTHVRSATGIQDAITPTRTRTIPKPAAVCIRYDSPTASRRSFATTVRNNRTAVAITDKVYVKHHRRIGDQLGTSIPRGAFSGATLDLLFTGEVDKLDDAARDRVLDFAEDFLDCNCDTNPYCGHPERKFVRYLLEQRAGGLSPEAIVDAMDADYGLYAYPGDVLSFLDDAVRTLEAAISLAEVEGNEGALTELRSARDALV